MTCVVILGLSRLINTYVLIYQSDFRCFFEDNVSVSMFIKVWLFSIWHEKSNSSPQFRSMNGRNTSRAEEGTVGTVVLSCQSGSKCVCQLTIGHIVPIGTFS